MAGFIADASAALPWCFAEEATPWTEALLERLQAGEPMVVPAHWPVEIMNGLTMALRRNGIDSDRLERFTEDLLSVSISIEPPHIPEIGAEYFRQLADIVSLPTMQPTWNLPSAPGFRLPPSIRTYTKRPEQSRFLYLPNSPEPDPALWPAARAHYPASSAPSRVRPAPHRPLRRYSTLRATTAIAQSPAASCPA